MRLHRASQHAKEQYKGYPFFAVDKNDDIYVYNRKPVLDKDCFICANSHIFIGKLDHPDVDFKWQKSLIDLRTLKV